MELRIKVELDMTERLSGLLTGLIGLLSLPRKPFENNAAGTATEEPEDGASVAVPEGADKASAAAIPEKPLPRAEEPVDEKVEADQLKGVMEVTIAKYAGHDWKERPTPENKKMVTAVSAVLKEIARCVSGHATDKPTELEGQQRVRFVKEIDNIFTNGEGKPEWQPF